VELEESKTSKIEKMRRHIKENKSVYIGTISGVIAGAVVVSIVMLRTRSRTTQINTGCAVNNIETDVTNIYQLVSRFGNKLGHPGNAVLDLNTGERWEAQHLAAKNLGVSDSRLSKHLNGDKPNLNGRVLVRVPSKKQMMNELEEQFNELLDEKFNSQYD